MRARHIFESQDAHTKYLAQLRAAKQRMQGLTLADVEIVLLALDQAGKGEMADNRSAGHVLNQLTVG